jgi:hypothetical protein
MKNGDRLLFSLFHWEKKIGDRLPFSLFRQALLARADINWKKGKG